MIPKRVLNPPSKTSSSLNGKCPKGANTDWDSPSSYTGTVKRRPPSIEATKFLLTPAINVDDDIAISSEKSLTKFDGVHKPSKDVDVRRRIIINSISSSSTSSPQEIVQGNCFRNEKKKGNESLEQKRYNIVSNQKSSCSSSISKKTTESLPISKATKTTTTGLQKKSKLRQPTNNIQLVSNQKSSTSTSPSASVWSQASVNASNKTNHLPKLSHIKKTQTIVGKKLENSKVPSAISNPQVSQYSSYLTSFGKKPTQNVVSVATIVQTKQQVAKNNTFNVSQLHKNKHSIAGGETGARATAQTSKIEYQFKKTASTTYTELYCDFPVNYASTTVVESIPLKPPPYCNPPSPPASPFKQKTKLIEQQENQVNPKKASRLSNENNKIQSENYKHIKYTLKIDDIPSSSPPPSPLQPHTKVTDDSNSIKCCIKTNEIQSKGNFALQKFHSISKLSGKNYRFLTSSTTKSASSEFLLPKHEDKDFSAPIIRVNSNDYVLFNPTRRQNTIANKMEPAAAGTVVAVESSTYDILAKPEFSSSLFKNIPVRPRKGIPHLENYCLFDPSTDFVNEKEHRKKDDEENDVNLTLNGDLDADEELIEEIIYEDQMFYDTLDADDDDDDYDVGNKFQFGKIDEVTEATTTSSSSQIDSSGSDLMQSSVIETSSPANIDSTDEQTELNRNHIEADVKISYRTLSPVSGVIPKKPLQIDKLFWHSSLPLPTTTIPAEAAASEITTPHPSRLQYRTSTNSDDSSHLNEFCQNVENQNEVNLSPSSSSLQFGCLLKQHTLMYHKQRQQQQRQQQQHQQPLKQSISSPQLQHVSYKSRNKSLPLVESNYVLFHPAPVHSRTPYKIRQPRPISTHSDADSGFLSPITPEPTEPKFNPTILVLQQCDSIQGYIEVIIEIVLLYLSI